LVQVFPSVSLTPSVKARAGVDCPLAPHFEPPSRVSLSVGWQSLETTLGRESSTIFCEQRNLAVRDIADMQRSHPGRNRSPSRHPQSHGESAMWFV